MSLNKLYLLIFLVALCMPSFAAGQSVQEISLEFKKIPVRELVQFLADQMHINVIMTEAVSGNVSLHFQHLSWGQALDAVLEISGLVKKEKGNLLFVGTASEFAAKQKSLLDAAPFKVVTIKLKHADVSVLSAILKNQPDILSSTAKINDNPRQNSLWIKEKIENIPTVLSYISDLDKPEKQILVTAKIIHIDDKKMQELGVHFSHIANEKSSGLNISLPEATNYMNLAIASIAQNRLINLQIEALESTGHSKLIADPRIITQNRKPAIIEAGEEIPYQESTSSGATSIAFKKAALSLKVIPTLLPDGRIILNLEITQNKTSSLSINGTPAIQTQELKTEVIVRDNETVILGGIFEVTRSKVSKGIPLLNKVPILGSLFSSKEKQVERKELVLFVSPHVLD